jgi:FAD:protein FMN transferase
VDHIAALLRERGLEHFLVEIGGETLAEGLNADGEPWRVGVLLPDDSGHLHGIIQATGGRAVATSGDYRNFIRDADGRIQSHIIDPRTAAPAGHAVASVSVLADDCLTADALATALLVLGHEEGLPLLAAAFPGTEALFILRSPDGGFQEAATRAFVSAARYQPPAP